MICEEIMKNQDYAVGFATVKEIEKFNILNASLMAMRRAVLSLGLKNDFLVLVDGKFCIPDLELEQMTLTQGELRAKPIAAASIVAKVMRDKQMLGLSKEYPKYDFEIHKGYPTFRHIKAIERYGPCAMHRKTFSRVKEFI